MMNRYAELAVWHGSCFAIMEQIYKNNLGKGVALVGNATPKRGFSDKNVSFLCCFSIISNFRFVIIRSCFYSRAVSLFGLSELPFSPGQMNSSSTPSCMIDITQHALFYSN